MNIFGLKIERIGSSFPVDNDWEEIWPGLPVHVLIMWSDKFIVFLDRNLCVDFKTKPEFDHKIETALSGKVLGEIREMEGIPIKHLDYSIRESFRSMLGEAFERALHDDEYTANQLLTGAREFINRRVAEKARMWLIFGSFSALVLVALVSLAFWKLWNPGGPDDVISLHQACVACFWGAVGACVSIISRAHRLKLESSAGRDLHFLEAFVRIFTGVVSAGLLWAAVKCGWLIPAMNTEHVLPFVLLGFVAGVSERIIKTLIHSIENTLVPAEKANKST